MARSQASSGYLLTGVRLAEARDIDRQDDIVLRGPDANAYLQQSIKVAEAAQRRRIRNVTYIIIGLSLALLFAIVQTWQARTQAEIRQARQ